MPGLILQRVAAVVTMEEGLLDDASQRDSDAAEVVPVKF